MEWRWIRVPQKNGNQIYGRTFYIDLFVLLASLYSYQPFGIVRKKGKITYFEIFVVRKKSPLFLEYDYVKLFNVYFNTYLL